MKWSEAKERDVIEVPSVNCNYRCTQCGWNPKERERRFAEGFWVQKDDGGLALRFRNVWSVFADLADEYTPDFEDDDEEE